MNPNYMEHRFPQIKPHPFSRVFKRGPPDAIELITPLLEYSPGQRLSAIEALVHPYFDELRDPETVLPDSRNPNNAVRQLPALFNFTRHELSIAPELNQKLVPAHAREALGVDLDNFVPLTVQEMAANLS